MLLWLLIPGLAVVAAAHRYLELYAPSNVLFRHLRRSEPRLRTAAALMALVAVLLVAMHGLARAVATGAPGFL